MKTPEQILAQSGDRPIDAAYELFRRFIGTEILLPAARSWMDWAIDRPCPATFEGTTPLKQKEAVFALMEAGTSGSPPFDAWVRRARHEQTLWGLAVRGAQPPHEPRYELGLLAVILQLWRHRSCLEQLPQIAAQLASNGSIRQEDAWRAAIEFCEYPELAYALLGPAQYRPPPEGWCDGCPKHPRDPRDVCAVHLQVVYERKARRLPAVERDEQIVAAFPAVAFLRERHLAPIMRNWLEARLDPPSGFWTAIADAVLEPPSRDWFAAIKFMCWDPQRHERAVTILADAVVAASNPAAVLENLVDDEWSLPGMCSGIFFGPGWGREHRRRKLLPLTRALLGRRVWPTRAWTRCIRPPLFWDRKPSDPHPETDEERAFEGQREILAEGLLSLILDDSGAVETAAAALDAIERLAPGGDGSWAKALSKVHAPGLASRAREVQKSLTDTRSKLVDAELAIEDAKDLLFERLSAAKGGQP